MSRFEAWARAVEPPVRGCRGFWLAWLATALAAAVAAALVCASWA